MQQVQLTVKDIVQLYMSVGGVPYYLKDIEPGQSVPQILDYLFFGPLATLRNEFANLYASLFKNSHLHVAVVKALAAKNKGLTSNEIITATGLKSGGGLTVLLNELAACGFVNVIAPVDKNKEDILYRLMDEYTLFYYKFLAGPKAGNRWEKLTGTPAYKIWSGLAFENLCFRHTAQIKKALGISGIISAGYSWIYKGGGHEKGAQIDFIIDRGDNCINILEAKFYNDVFEVTKEYAERLRQKVQVFRKHTRTRKNIFVTLLTVYGAVKNKYYLAEVTNQLLAEDLFT